MYWDFCVLPHSFLISSHPILSFDAEADAEAFLMLFIVLRQMSVLFL